jgi:hypothetical protein
MDNQSMIVISKQFDYGQKLTKEQNELKNSITALLVGFKIQEVKDVLAIIDYELSYITIK